MPMCSAALPHVGPGSRSRYPCPPPTPHTSDFSNAGGLKCERKQARLKPQKLQAPTPNLVSTATLTRHHRPTTTQYPPWPTATPPPTITTTTEAADTEVAAEEAEAGSEGAAAEEEADTVADEAAMEATSRAARAASAASGRRRRTSWIYPNTRTRRSASSSPGAAKVRFVVWLACFAFPPTAITPVINPPNLNGSPSTPFRQLKDDVLIRVVFSSSHRYTQRLRPPDEPSPRRGQGDHARRRRQRNDAPAWPDRCTRHHDRIDCPDGRQ